MLRRSMLLLLPILMGVSLLAPNAQAFSVSDTLLTPVFASLHDSLMRASLLNEAASLWQSIGNFFTTLLFPPATKPPLPPSHSPSPTPTPPLSSAFPNSPAALPQGPAANAILEVNPNTSFAKGVSIAGNATISGTLTAGGAVQSGSVLTTSLTAMKVCQIC